MEDSKTCTCCMSSLPLNLFAPQKTNPKKLYAWCNPCRRANVPRVGALRSEYKALREKALEKRRFDNAQAEALRLRKEAGTKVDDLAKEYGCSTTTIYKTLRRK